MEFKTESALVLVKDLCKNCEKNPISYWCENCSFEGEKGRFRGEPICSSCWPVIHQAKYMRGHKNIPYEFFKILNDQFSVNADESSFSEDCMKSTLVFVNPFDYKLNFARSYYELGAVLQPSDRPAVISFVGPTGAGKSLLLRMLMILMSTVNTDRLFGLPIPGQGNSAQSTSSDIHLYLSGSITGEEFPALFLDAEGVNGNLEPKGLGYYLKSFANILYSNSQTYLEKRRVHVENSYPKLQYLFSDVICFVTDCSWKQRQSITEKLISWATTGVTGITNVPVKPKLLIIFNKVQLETLESPTQTPTQQFFHGIHDVWEQLSIYYSSPEVILIPNACFQLSEAQKSIETLKDIIVANCKTIRSSRSGAGHLRTMKSLRRMLYQAVKSINNPSPNGCVEIENTNEGLIDSHLGNFFVQCQKIFGYEVALKMLKSRLRDVPFLYQIRTEDNGLPVGKIARLLLEGNNKPVEPIDLPDEPLETYTDDSEDETMVPPEIPYWKGRLDWLDKFVVDCGPCGAVHTFQSMNGPVTFSCECNRASHAFHAAKSTYKVDKRTFWNMFGSIKDLPASWPNVLDTAKPEPLGLYLFACRQLFKFPQWSEKVIFDNHFKRVEKFRDEYVQLAPAMITTCIGCLLITPSEKLGCGHMFCKMCCEEIFNYNNCRCPICNNPLPPREKNELKPTMGYRILCLDGGGVKGIVELVTLMYIEKLLDMPFSALFDAIFGTSTGSVLAAATCFTMASRAGDVESQVESLVKAVFTKHEKNSFFDYFSAFLWRGYIYDPAGFDQKLKDFKLDNPMLFWNDHLKIGFTSCLYEDKLPATLFANYNRDPKGLDDPLYRVQSRDYTVRDAVRASSAAGFYFPPFVQETSGLAFTDGGMQNNCPAVVALKEAEYLWPDRNCDILLSLGTGAYRSSDIKAHDIVPNDRSLMSLIGFAKNAIDLTVDTEKIWLQVKNKPFAYRINPVLKEKVGLDAVSKLEKLKADTQDYLNSAVGTEQLHIAAARLLASLFYLEPITLRFSSIVFDLKSRVPISGKAKDFLQAFKFSVDHTSNDKNDVSNVSTSIINQERIRGNITFVQTGNYEERVEISDLPAIRPLTVSGTVEIEINGQNHSFSISGGNYTITVLSEL